MMARRSKKQKILPSEKNTKSVKDENLHPGAVSVIESIQDALSSAAGVGTVQYVQAGKELGLQQAIVKTSTSLVFKRPSGTVVKVYFPDGQVRTS
jgi:hypothetical protein